MIAFTATADKATRANIVRRLFDREPRVFLHSFDRPNIELNFAVKEQPRKQLSRFLARHKGDSGIVYCGSRKATEQLAAFFVSEGHDAIAYHAGLDPAVRARNQDRFLREDGVVAAATIAFGMGVNKPDVRFVAHADMPASVESYYQEIGRAGRDGLPADTLTLYGLDDMAFRRRQIDQKDLPEERRRAEHARFSALATLCKSPRCRQTLLAYFDEESPPCGRCDVCLGKVAVRDGTIEAQKVLSAAARTGQRFGAAYLADILTGSASETIARNGHDSIKTFGAGKEHSKTVWTSIIRQLFAVGALQSASAEHGGFALTPKGEEILFGREKSRAARRPGKAARAKGFPARRAGRRRGGGRRSGRAKTQAARPRPGGKRAGLHDLRRPHADRDGRKTSLDAGGLAPRSWGRRAQDRPLWRGVSGGVGGGVAITHRTF